METPVDDTELNSPQDAVGGNIPNAIMEGQENGQQEIVPSSPPPSYECVLEEVVIQNWISNNLNFPF